jgi:hypothetical protein
MRTSLRVWLRDLSGRTLEAGLQIGLPLFFLALLPVLGLLIWDLGSLAVKADNLEGWVAIIFGIIGFTLALFVRVLLEQSPAWHTHIVLALNSITLLHAWKSWVAVLFVGYAIGILIADYEALMHRRRQ